MAGKQDIFLTLRQLNMCGPAGRVTGTRTAGVVVGWPCSEPVYDEDCQTIHVIGDPERYLIASYYDDHRRPLQERRDPTVYTHKMVHQ